MHVHKLTAVEAVRAAGIGVATALLLSAVMVPALKLGISPLPKPLGLAFAETLLGGPLPLPVGLLFHVAYVTAWTLVYVVLSRPTLSFGNALALAMILWLLVLLVFFPLVGWGVLGLAIGPQLIVASLVPHLLFAVIVWGLCRLGLPRSSAAATVGE